MREAIHGLTAATAFRLKPEATESYRTFRLKPEATESYRTFRLKPEATESYRTFRLKPEATSLCGNREPRPCARL